MPAVKSAMSLLTLLLMATWISSCSPAPQASLRLDPVQETTAPQKAIFVTVPGSDPLTQPPVTFSHQDHSKMSCELCHHAVSGNSLSCCVPECHVTRGTFSEWHSYYRAFHAMEGPSCLNCHVEEQEHGQNKDVPTECKECHQAELGA